MSKPHLNTATPRLTDLPGTKHPLTCQACGCRGRLTIDTATCDHSERLDRWQEHDHHDKPEPRVLVLCQTCSKRIIEPHPRLYSRLSLNAPWPGCMPLCLDCRHRTGIACTHPDAKANGGPGVGIAIEPPQTALVDGRNYSGPIQIWPSPARACKQHEKVETTLRATCSECQASVVLASGYSAEAIRNDERRYGQAVMAAGWFIAPILCPACKKAIRT